MHYAETPGSIPVFPRPAALALRLPPLAPLSVALTALARRITRRHPELLTRLGSDGAARFVIDPTDLPMVLQFDLRASEPHIRVLRRDPGGDARIAGPMAALLGLVHGVYDGDALFFSRDLVIEGDTAATLALRNAIDDAELDLSEEIDALPMTLSRPLRALIRFAERRTGVALTRPEEDY
ncbi:ubiquinone anaerobic biosynthesis accessory factor UbiT [Shimia biformata]|uniref:ubiquinone anaerobic biosynthesis accessory factor UbiT n=1 Tax=Shimia biformata TaxID=1294299 RepID=UPI001EF20041|nr:SCP2 sterol-binding domain-containing protein [Shimia biformata]